LAIRSADLAVVGAAGATIAQDPPGFHNLFEPVSGGAGQHVGMKLLDQASERDPDVLAGRIRRDAQNLVVVVDPDDGCASERILTPS
jgi:hypothetical protein